MKYFIFLVACSLILHTPIFAQSHGQGRTSNTAYMEISTPEAQGILLSDEIMAQCFPYVQGDDMVDTLPYCLDFFLRKKFLFKVFVYLHIEDNIVPIAQYEFGKNCFIKKLLENPQEYVMEPSYTDVSITFVLRTGRNQGYRTFTLTNDMPLKKIQTLLEEIMPHIAKAKEVTTQKEVAPKKEVTALKKEVTVLKKEVTTQKDLAPKTEYVIYAYDAYTIRAFLSLYCHLFLSSRVFSNSGFFPTSDNFNPDAQNIVIITPHSKILLKVVKVGHPSKNAIMIGSKEFQFMMQDAICLYFTPKNVNVDADITVTAVF